LSREILFSACDCVQKEVKRAAGPEGLFSIEKRRFHFGIALDPASV